jgi:hypothetical protein
MLHSYSTTNYYSYQYSNLTPFSNFDKEKLRPFFPPTENLRPFIMKSITEKSPFSIFCLNMEGLPEICQADPRVLVPNPSD